MILDPDYITIFNIKNLFN